VIDMLRSRGEPRLHLVVTRTNEPAVALYRSLGFVEKTNA
jgi:ribosomal protein S18 acetylase RimI-like enzyme